MAAMSPVKPVRLGSVALVKVALKIKHELKKPQERSISRGLSRSRATQLFCLSF